MSPSDFVEHQHQESNRRVIESIFKVYVKFSNG